MTFPLTDPSKEGNVVQHSAAQVINDPNCETRALQREFGWEAKTVVLGAGVMLALAFGALLPVLPQIEAALSRGPQDSFLIKQLFGIVGLSIVIGAPLAGFLVDRVGVRIIVTVAGLVICIAGTAGLYVNSLPVLVGSRMLLGIAAGAIDTTSVAIINTRLHGNERAKWNGTRIAVTLICSVIMQPTVGYIAQFGWRAPFAVYTLGLPLGLIGAFALKNERLPRECVAAIQKEARFRDWFPFRYALLALVLGIMTYLPVVYGPFLMRQRGVSSPVTISLVLMGTSTIGAVSSMLYGPFRRNLSIEGAFTFSLAWWGAGTLIAALTPTFTGAVIGLLVGFVGYGWVVPNLMTAVGESVALSQQGRAVGLVRTMHELAAPACIVLVEPVAKKFGPDSAIMISSILAIGMLAVFARKIALGKHVRA